MSVSETALKRRLRPLKRHKVYSAPDGNINPNQPGIAALEMAIAVYMTRYGTSTKAQRCMAAFRKHPTRVTLEAALSAVLALKEKESRACQ